MFDKAELAENQDLERQKLTNNLARLREMLEGATAEDREKIKVEIEENLADLAALDLNISGLV